MERPFAKVSTKELEFALGVGKAGLTMWKKGKKLEEVREHCAALALELAIREMEGVTKK